MRCIGVPTAKDELARSQSLAATTCPPNLHNAGTLCPVCGASVTLTGKTKDGRFVGSCGDAFTQDRWDECEGCGAPNARGAT